MNAYALKAPAQDWKIPAWVTPHNLVLIAGAVAAGLVIILLARAVGRLAKLAKAAAAPVAAPKKSSGGGMLLLAGAAGVGGLVLYERHQNAAAPAKAAPAPAPSPSPTPRPTVTQTVAPPAGGHSGSSNILGQLTAWMNHLTGTDWVLIVLIGAVATFVIVRPLLQRSGS
jgi:hypothetical protein